MKFKAFILVSALFIVPDDFARAATVNWAFSGSVFAEQSSGYAVNDTVTGSFSFNPDTPQTPDPAFPDYGFFYGAISQFTIGHFEAQLTPSNNQITLLNNTSFPGGTAVLDAFDGTVADSTGHFAFTVLSADLGLITSYALPTTPYDLSNKPNSDEIASLRNFDTGLYLDVEITSLILASAIPEPATWITIILGFALLASIRENTRFSARRSLI